MSLKTVVNAHYNYTGRKAIKQKPEYFVINVSERKNNTAQIDVKYDFGKIIESINIEESAACALVVDAYVRNDVTRSTLDKEKRSASFLIHNCPEYENISFRIKIVATAEDQKGILIAANKSRIVISNKSTDGENENEEINFFELKPDSEMKGQFWRVDWNQTDNPEIYVNKRLYEFYAEKRQILEAYILPEIVREILTGLLFRQKDLIGLPEDKSASKWITFFHQVLLEDLEKLSKEDPDVKFEKIDEISTSFADRKWRNGATLLDDLIVSSS